MTAINNNTANVLNIGSEAARRWTLSSTHGEAGDANAIVALVYAERMLTFTATVERKKEDTTEQFDFSVLDLATPLYNNDGSKDTRAMAARTLALSSRLFGIEELTNAIKTRLARSIKAAVYLINALKHLSDEELQEAVCIKGGKLVAPYGLVKPAPAEDASDNEKIIYEAMKDKPLSLDGKDGASLAELNKRAAPPKATRAAGENKSDGASFNASLAFVSAIVSQQINEEADETEIALSNEQRRALFALSQHIAAYFAADPIEEEELQSEAA